MGSYLSNYSKEPPLWPKIQMLQLGKLFQSMFNFKDVIQITCIRLILYLNHQELFSISLSDLYSFNAVSATMIIFSTDAKCLP
jgi:hypothetical protein